MPDGVNGRGVARAMKGSSTPKETRFVQWPVLPRTTSGI